jgi:hypothetical protein
VLREHREAMKAAGVDGYKTAERGAPKATALEAMAKMYEHKEEAEDPAHKFTAVKAKNTRLALALQRQYRHRLQFHVVRWLNARHRAAFDVQRVFRGHVDREFAREWREVSTIGAITIQAGRRAMFGRVAARARRAMLTALALAVQPAWRGVMGRAFVAWVRRNAVAGTQLQRVCRGFVDRQHAKRLVRRRFYQVFVRGRTVRIQAWWRAQFAKTVLGARRAVRYFWAVEVPASVVCERVYRGHRGREEAAYRRCLRDAATLAQALWRRFVARCLFLAMARAKLEAEQSLVIQAWVRGVIGREVAGRLAARRHFEEKELPAILRIQTCYRRYVCMRNLARRKAEWRAATLIQRPYRKALARRKQNEEWARMRQEWIEMVTRKLQRCWRGHFARVHVATQLKAQHGVWGAAALVCQSCWRRFVAARLVKAKRKAWQLEELWEMLEESQEELREIALDLEAARRDIAARNTSHDRRNARIHELRHQRNVWAQRLPAVEELIEKVTPDDINHGWAEAYETEWDMITNGNDMLEEELRGRKIQRRVAFADLEELYLEVEDLEQDRDENCTMETLQYEKFRRLELARADERRETAKSRHEHQTRLRWQIKTTRAKVIKKGRKDLARAAKAAQHELSVEECSTISYKVRFGVFGSFGHRFLAPSLARSLALRHLLCRRRRPMMTQNTHSNWS